MPATIPIPNFPADMLFKEAFRRGFISFKTPDEQPPEQPQVDTTPDISIDQPSTPLEGTATTSFPMNAPQPMPDPDTSVPVRDEYSPVSIDTAKSGMPFYAQPQPSMRAATPEEAERIADMPLIKPERDTLEPAEAGWGGTMGDEYKGVFGKAKFIAKFILAIPELFVTGGVNLAWQMAEDPKGTLDALAKMPDRIYDEVKTTQQFLEIPGEQRTAEQNERIRNVAKELAVSALTFTTAPIVSGVKAPTELGMGAKMTRMGDEFAEAAMKRPARITEAKWARLSPSEKLIANTIEIETALLQKSAAGVKKFAEQGKTPIGQLRDIKIGMQGREQGRKQATAVLLKQFKEDTTKIKGMAGSIIEYAKAYLPAEARTGIVEALTQARTSRRLFELAGRTTTRIEKFEKAGFIEDIKGLKGLEPSADVKKYFRSQGITEGIQIDVKYQKMIQKVSEIVDVAKPSEETVRKLEGLKEYLTRHPELGEKHPELALSVRRLGKKPLKDMSYEDLSKLRDQLSSLEHEGVAMYIGKERLKKTAIAAEIAKAVSSTTSKDPWFRSRLPGKKISWTVRGVLGEIRSLTDTPIRIMDRIGDDLQHFMGWNAKSVRDANGIEVNIKYISNQQKGGLFDGMAPRMESLTPDSEAVIYAHALNKRGAPEAVKEILDEMGLTELRALTADEAAILPAIRPVLDDIGKQVAAVYEKTENKIFSLEKDYIPIARKGRAFEDDIEALLIKDYSYRQVSPEAGFTKVVNKRAELPMRTDFFNIIAEHIDDANWYIVFKEKLTMLKRVTSSPEYLAKANKTIATYWNDFIDVVARRGWASGINRTNLSRMVGAMTEKVTQALLTYKITSALVQPFAVVDAYSMMVREFGVKAANEMLAVVVKGWGQAVVSPGLTKAQIAADPFLSVRLGGAGEVAVEELSRIAGGTKSGIGAAYRKTIKAGLTPLKTADVLTTKGIRDGIEKVLLKNGMPAQEARGWAITYADMVSGSSNITMRPLLYSKGDYAKLVGALQSFVMNRWNMIVENAMYSGKAVSMGELGQAAKSLTALGILVGAGIAEDIGRKELYNLITNRDEKDKEKLATTMVGSVVGNVPVFGGFFDGLASSLMEKGQEREYKHPIIGAGEDVGKGVWKAITAKRKLTKVRGLTKAGIGVLEILGVPASSQLGQIALSRMKAKKIYRLEE